MRKIHLELSQKHRRTGINCDVIADGGLNRSERRRLAKIARTRSPHRVKSMQNW